MRVELKYNGIYGGDILNVNKIILSKSDEKSEHIYITADKDESEVNKFKQNRITLKGEHGNIFSAAFYDETIISVSLDPSDDNARVVNILQDTSKRGSVLNNLVSNMHKIEEIPVVEETKEPVLKNLVHSMNTFADKERECDAAIKELASDMFKYCDEKSLCDDCPYAIKCQQVDDFTGRPEIDLVTLCRKVDTNELDPDKQVTYDIRILEDILSHITSNKEALRYKDTKEKEPVLNNLVNNMDTFTEDRQDESEMPEPSLAEVLARDVFKYCDECNGCTNCPYASICNNVLEHVNEPVENIYELCKYIDYTNGEKVKYSINRLKCAIRDIMSDTDIKIYIKATAMSKDMLEVCDRKFACRECRYENTMCQDLKSLYGADDFFTVQCKYSGIDDGDDYYQDKQELILDIVHILKNKELDKKVETVITEFDNDINSIRAEKLLHVCYNEYMCGTCKCFDLCHELYKIRPRSGARITEEYDAIKQSGARNYNDLQLEVSPQLVQDLSNIENPNEIKILDDYPSYSYGLTERAYGMYKSCSAILDGNGDCSICAYKETCVKLIQFTNVGDKSIKELYTEFDEEETYEHYADMNRLICDLHKMKGAK